jgi:hypothetical protein
MSTPLNLRPRDLVDYAKAPLSWHEWVCKEEKRERSERRGSGYVAEMRLREDSDLIGDHFRDLGR